MYRLILTFFFLAGLSILVYFSVNFYGYYSLPLVDRPHTSLHQLAKPGGKAGHGFGVIGSSMILLLFLYSVRRRGVIRWGSLTNWLNLHIIFGILGPLYVTLHTAFKFGGIVSVSYFSMVAVMMSGIFGRYLYLQIPRAMTGGELSRREIDACEEKIRTSLIEGFDMNAEMIDEFESILGGVGGRDKSAVRILMAILVNDLIRVFRNISMRRAIRKKYPDLSLEKLERLNSGIKDLVLLRRKIRFLDTIQQLFYYWHVIHRPFAFVMVLIMFIHVGAVIYFGYRWIF